MLHKVQKIERRIQKIQVLFLQNMWYDKLAILLKCKF